MFQTPIFPMNIWTFLVFILWRIFSGIQHRLPFYGIGSIVDFMTSSIKLVNK